MKKSCLSLADYRSKIAEYAVDIVLEYALFVFVLVYVVFITVCEYAVVDISCENAF